LANKKKASDNKPTPDPSEINSIIKTPLPCATYKFEPALTLNLNFISQYS